MVAGLAPEKFSAYIGQQVRWARGMAQILRLEWPMFNSKLTWAQRICYTSATSHFFFGFPRLMYAIAPVAFLLFGINSVRGLGLETLTYALPSILLALNANYVIYKGVRFSFWNEIFEYALAFQDGLVTFMAMVNPKLGSFNVTDKGLTVSRRSFDLASVNVLMSVFILSLVSLVAVPYWLLTGYQDSDAVLINAVWCVINVALITAAILVALEQPQLRQAHRLNRSLRVRLHSGDQTFYGTTKDVSETGAQIHLNSWPNLPDLVEIELSGDTVASVSLKGKIVRVTPYENDEVIVAVIFENITPKQKDDLVLVLFSDVDEWYSQTREQQDNPLQSVLFLLTSLLRAFRNPQVIEPTEVRKRVKTNVALYAQGHYFQAVGQEINSRSLRLLLSSENLSFLHPEILTKGQPVGLIVGSDHPQDQTRLIAQVDEILHPADNTGETIVEVSFPKVLSPRQNDKVDHLLHTL
jgi:cellulose synthase (UDP-forming)